MKHYLLNHQPQKGLQAACAQQGQAPTCNARGKGHTPASPKTLTRILLVLLTMLLLPSAAWGQTTITVAGNTPDATTGTITGDGITSGTVSFDASSNTLILDNARVTGTISSSIANLNINLKGFSLFTLDNESGSAVLIDYTGDTQTTSPKVTFLADKLGASLIAIGSQIEGHSIYITLPLGYNTDANPDDVWSINQNPYTGGKKIVLVSKPYMIIHRAAYDFEIDDSYLDNTNENLPKIDWLSFTPATDNTQFMLKLKQSEEDRDNGENTLISPITIRDGLSELVIDLDGNIGINTEYSYQTNIAPINSKNGGGAKSTTIKFTSSTEGSLTLSRYEGMGLLENVTPIYDTGWSATITNPEGVTDITQATEAIIAKPYDLSVAGIPVTSANAYNVLGDGKVSFTPAEGTTPATLTLNNANITVSGNNAIESGLENLTVNLVGGDNDNVITCQGSTDCVFKGTVSGAKVTFTTDATTPGVLTGSVSQESYMFVGIETIFQNGLNYRREGDSYYIDTKVGLKIGDTEITSANIGSDGTITGISAISSGTVKFTPADNTTMPATPATLTLNGASLTAGIVTGMNMTIDLKGNNSITVNRGYALSVPNNESPTITFTSSSSPIGNLTLKSTASEVNGLVGVNINILYDTSKGIVPSFLVTTAADPTTANFTNSTEAVITNGTAYGLYIADVPVTNSNASGITGSGIKGTVTYADATKTLTLNGAEITGNISSSISELKVYLIGKNSITPANGSTPFAYTGAVGTTSPQLSFESSEADDGELTLSGDITTSGSGQNITLSSGGYSYSNTFGTGESVTTFGDWIIDYPDSKKRIYYNPHYGITVGNYEVTKKNKGMVTNLSGSDIKYLPEDQALLIPSNSTFANYTIKSHREELTIYVSGDCVSKSIIFESNSNFPATSGVLIIKKDPSSTASINKLTLNNTDGVITGFSNVTIDESLNLLTPATTPTWDATVTEAVFTDETLYDLWVEGIRVTSGNKDNVKGEYSTNVDDPITPSVVFDGNNKLTLTNASITVTDKNAIESGIENLTVNLVGRENIITCQGTNDVAFKAVGSGSKITFTTTSEYEAVSLYISGCISPIEGLDTDYENGLGFLYSSTDQRYSVETLETPEIKKTAETEDGITVALVLPSGDKYSSNTTMYYKITYSDSDETTGFSEYSNAFTMTKPGTVTAYLVPLGGQSANAVAKYFGYPDAPYTLAVGDEITPAIYPAIDSNDGIEQSGASSGNEDIASFTYSDGIVKATGIGNTTLTATFTAGDQPFTVLNPIADPQAPHEFTATFSVIVGGSLSDYFEGSNEFGSFYNTSETTYAVPEGMTAYVITGADPETGKVTTAETTVLPPNTPVLLEKGSAKAFTYIPATSGTAPSVNILLYTGNTDVQATEGSNLYVLYNDKFVKVTTGTRILSQKCYLKLNTSSGTRGYYDIDGSDGTTGIREVKSEGVKGEKLADGAWHDLQGRRLSAKPTKPGLYILNGKKVAIK